MYPLAGDLPSSGWMILRHAREKPWGRSDSSEMMRESPEKLGRYKSDNDQYGNS
jgi:hypothetical protein